MNNFFKIVKKFGKAEYVMLAFITCFSGVFLGYIHSLDLITRLVDQNSHLNLARLVWDSLTPGISQIGFWPPLLHILMFPFTISDVFFKNGFAGALVLIPCYLLASLFLYKLIFHFTRSWWIALMGVLSFSLNPYVLYYTVTPMMEVLFISNLFAVIYFLCMWMESEKIRYLVLTSIFVGLACVSRFEGFLILPLVGIVLLFDLIRKKRGYQEIEATSIVYSILAVSGIVFILVYGLVYGNNPLAFANSNWSAFSQQRDFFLPTEKNATVSFTYLIHASYHMLGYWQVWVGLIFSVLLLIGFFSLEVVAVILILFSPFLFDWLALYRGNIILYVSELPPYGTFFNERYGLYWIGLTAFAPAAFLGLLKARYVGSSIRYFLLGVIFLTSFSILLLSTNFLYKIAVQDRFTVVSESAQGYPSEDQRIIARTLSSQYDGGKILITRALHDFVTVNAGVPLRNYIHESNHLYYDQALEKPWIFSRWVVMYTLSEESSQLDWSKKNEKISARWGNSEEFLQYYELVVSNERESLYRIKEAAVLESADRLGLNPLKVPSLNVGISEWNPTTVFDDMKYDK